MSGQNRTVDDDNDSFYDADSYATPQGLTVDPKEQPNLNAPKLSPYAPMPSHSPPKAPGQVSVFEEKNNPETSLPIPQHDHRKSYTHSEAYENRSFPAQSQPQPYQHGNQASYQSAPVIPFVLSDTVGDMLEPPAATNGGRPQHSQTARDAAVIGASGMNDAQSTANSSLDTVDVNSYQNMTRSSGREQSQSSIPDQNSSYQYPYRPYESEGGAAFTVNYENRQSLTLNEGAPPPRTLGNRGDSTLRPNTGLTNSYDYSLWGLAPHELLRFLQQMNMVASASCVVIAVFSWLGKLIFLQLDQVVLLAYLAFFSFVLGLVDLMALSTPEAQRLIPDNMMGKIRDQLGFLFQPWGKALFVLLLTTMCWGIGGLFLGIAGTVYFISSLGWFYAAVAYRDDIPRLMGSIEQTYIAESRRRNAHSRTFSVASWEGIMRDHVAAAAAVGTSWTSWTNTRRTTPVHDTTGVDGDANHGVGGDANDEPGERASLIRDQR